MTELLSVEKLVKRYGKGDTAFDALKGVDLDIQKGETIAIIGKSGSGKSTLMHLLALLDSPTEGHVYIEGQNADKLHTHKLNVIRNGKFGFVFQQFFLNANESVLDNVTLPLKIGGVNAKERKERGLKALAEVELSDKAKEKANNLSGGQKQRVAIARALVNDPEVIFADEPTGNLDSVTGDRIEKLLFNLNKHKGITLIIVTHDEELAHRCKRKIYLKDGKILRSKK